LLAKQAAQAQPLLRVRTSLQCRTGGADRQCRWLRARRLFICQFMLIAQFAKAKL
jgi:hypothetical protein